MARLSVFTVALSLNGHADIPAVERTHALARCRPKSALNLRLAALEGGDMGRPPTEATSTEQ